MWPVGGTRIAKSSFTMASDSAACIRPECDRMFSGCRGCVRAPSLLTCLVNSKCVCIVGVRLA